MTLLVAWGGGIMFVSFCWTLIAFCVKRRCLLIASLVNRFGYVIFVIEYKLQSVCYLVSLQVLQVLPLSCSHDCILDYFGLGSLLACFWICYKFDVFFLN